MFSQLRRIVAGPKNRTISEDFDLDFTYITDTVVAMAYPASGFEKTYRNSIHDVVKYLQSKHHEGYLIINVSNRKYDYTMFKGMVKDYVWEDHQAPCLDTLFELCWDSLEFLKEKNRIVCFHCNHGKGRTGTAIICLFLFTGFFKNVKESLKFYNKKRFNSSTYGVSQPCQIRYMEYFLKVMNEANSPNCRTRIKSYRLYRIQFEGIEPNQYEINIYSTRSQKQKYQKIELGESISTDKSHSLFSDIYIEVKKKGWMVDSVVARANVNLNLMTVNNETQVFWSMEGSEVRVSKSHHHNFMIDFFFTQFCKCHQVVNLQCECQLEREIEQKSWDKMIGLAHQGTQLMSRQVCKILFPTFVGLQEQERKTQIVKKQILSEQTNTQN